jgi:hypothetical protein
MIISQNLLALAGEKEKTTTYTAWTVGGAVFCEADNKKQRLHNKFRIPAGGKEKTITYTTWTVGGAVFCEADKHGFPCQMLLWWG